MTAKRFLIKIVPIITGLVLSGLGLPFFFYDSPLQILIESEESKTLEGMPVFNKISFSQEKNLDVWEMQQSHHGANPAHKDKWEDLKITVDKSISPNKVQYFQLKVENGKERQSEYRVSCFFCHANGPRAIRHVENSADAPLGLKEKIILQLWNLRIKSYKGLVLSEENLLLEGKARSVPLKLSSPYINQELKIKTCLLCHDNKGFLQRGPLNRQHAGTISHLTSTNQMPPWPFKLQADEKKELERFLKGF